MANIYVYSAAAGAANGTSWTDAYTGIAAALAVATASDTIFVASDHSQLASTTLTLSCPASSGLKVLSVDRTTGALTPGAVIGIASALNSVSVQNFGYFYGIHFTGTTSSSSTGLMLLGSNSTEHSLYFEECKFIQRGTNLSQCLFLGQSAQAGNDEIFIRMRKCQFKFGGVAQSVRLRNARVEMVECSLDPTSTVVTSLFETQSGIGSVFSANGCDFSGFAWTNLLSATSCCASMIRFSQCKFPSGWNAYVATSLAPSWELWVLDCSDGDNHGLFQYHNVLGSIVSDTTTRLTAGAAGQSWKVTTTSQCKPTQPFVTPWVDWYNTTLSSMTPYFECLRNSGTASAYTDAEVCAEFLVKDISGTTLCTLHADGISAIDTPTAQAAGVGTGSWTIASSNSPYSFKCDSGSAVTPAEVGHIRGRLRIGLALTGVLHINPQIQV